MHLHLRFIAALLGGLLGMPPAPMPGRADATANIDWFARNQQAHVVARVLIRASVRRHRSRRHASNPCRLHRGCPHTSSRTSGSHRRASWRDGVSAKRTGRTCDCRLPRRGRELRNALRWRSAGRGAMDRKRCATRSRLLHALRRNDSRHLLVVLEVRSVHAVDLPLDRSLHPAALLSEVDRDVRSAPCALSPSEPDRAADGDGAPASSFSQKSGEIGAIRIGSACRRWRERVALRLARRRQPWRSSCSRICG